MKEPDPLLGDSPEESLERMVLGEDPTHSAIDVAAETGITIDQARRLWRALGFPDHGVEIAFTRSDVEAVSKVMKLIESGVLDFDIAVDLTRAIGQNAARLADWEVGTMVARVQRVVGDDKTVGARRTAGREVLRQVVEPLSELLVYVWRRHLAAALARLEALGQEEDLTTTDLTVGFVDIVGFTELSNQLGQAKIGEVVEMFEFRCADIVAGKRGRVIKTIGDAVLFVHDDPIKAYDIAEGIITVVGRDGRMPDIRVGLATGTVVQRLGDVFGPPVNLASRLTGVARRNRIIVDQRTADLLPEDQFEHQLLPARPVRGFGLLQPVAIRRH